LSDLGFHASRRSAPVGHCGLTGTSSSGIAKLDVRATDLGEITVLLVSWRLRLEASNLSPRTIRAYMEDGALLAAFLAAKGMPTAVLSMRREHVEAFIGRKT
jgi:hypothetical protein